MEGKELSVGISTDEPLSDGEEEEADEYSSDNERSALYALSFLCAATASGMVYGWPVLRRSLMREPGFDLTETQLGVAYTAGSWSANAGRLASGLIRDAIGTRYTCVLCLGVVLAGALITATASLETSNAGITAGMFCLGIGTGVLLCVQPVCALFPQSASTAMASLSGAFQVSGVVFMALDWMAPNDRQTAFSGYAVYVALLACVCMKLLPKTAKFRLSGGQAQAGSAVAAKGTGSRRRCSGSGSDVAAPTNDTADSRLRALSVERTEGVVNGTDKWDQLRSREYRMLLLWFCCVMPAMQFYVLGVGYQLELWGDTDGTYSRVFIWAQGGFALCSPLTGWLADWAGLGCAQGLATMLIALSFACLALPRADADADGGAGGLPLEVQVVGIVCYAIGRGLTFGMYFSNIGRRFGYEHYGLLVGFGLLLAALTSLLQYPLLWWCVAGEDRGTNVVCCLSCVATLPYAYWLRRREQAESVISASGTDNAAVGGGGPEEEVELVDVKL